MPLDREKDALIGADGTPDCRRSRRNQTVWFAKSDHPIYPVSSRSFQLLFVSCANRKRAGYWRWRTVAAGYRVQFMFGNVLAFGLYLNWYCSGINAFKKQIKFQHRVNLLRMYDCSLLLDLLIRRTTAIRLRTQRTTAIRTFGCRLITERAEIKILPINSVKFLFCSSHWVFCTTYHLVSTTIVQSTTKMKIYKEIYPINYVYSVCIVYMLWINWCVFGLDKQV
jgi:hypothetical protein